VRRSDAGGDFLPRKTFGAIRGIARLRRTIPLLFSKKNLSSAFQFKRLNEASRRVSFVISQVPSILGILRFALV